MVSPLLPLSDRRGFKGLAGLLEIQSCGFYCGLKKG